MIAVDRRLRDASVAHASANALCKGRPVQYEAHFAKLTNAASVDDPTGAIATSPTRLALSAAIEDGIARLDAATAELRSATGRLNHALETHMSPYAGDPLGIAAPPLRNGVPLTNERHPATGGRATMNRSPQCAHCARPEVREVNGPSLRRLFGQVT